MALRHVPREPQDSLGLRFRLPNKKEKVEVQAQAAGEAERVETSHRRCNIMQLNDRSNKHLLTITISGLRSFQFDQETLVRANTAQARALNCQANQGHKHLPLFSLACVSGNSSFRVFGGFG